MNGLQDGQVRFVPRAIRISRADTDTARRRDSAEMRRNKVEQRVLEFITELSNKPDGKNFDVQGWLRGEPGLTIPDEAVRRLRSLIEEEYSGRELAWANNFLARELESGIRLHGWIAQPIPRIIRLGMPKSPMTPITFEFLAQADRLRHHLLDLLENENSYSPEKLPGLAILCSVMLSAVLHQNKLLSMMQNIDRGLRWHERTVWVEWQPDHGWERVCLDPVSACVMIKLKAAMLDGKIDRTRWDTKGMVNEAIRPLLPKAIGVRSLRDLIRIARADWVYHLPPFLYQWAIGKQPSTVLPSDAWYRLLSRQQLSKSVEPTKSKDIDQPENPLVLSSTGGESKFADDIWVGRYRKLLRQVSSKHNRLTPAQTQRNLLTELQQYDQRSLPYLMGSWLVDLIKARRSKGQGLRVSSARTMLCNIDRRLALMVGQRYPSDIEHENEWEELLESLAQSIRPTHRNNVVIALKSLHSHMVAQHGFTELDGVLSDGADARVDANFVSEIELNLVLCRLGQQLTARRANYCRVAALLGFRGKMRRSETWGLMLSDWKEGPIPEILCQPNSHRNLKTSSGRRRIILDGHFTPEEIRLMRTHVDEVARLAMQHGIAPDRMPIFPDHAELLSGVVSDVAPMNMRHLINPIEDAMRAVAGDASLRFHHLRHSGANNEVSLCLATDFEGMADLTIAPDEDVAMRSASLRKNLLNNDQARHALLRAVSASAGHASPETTLMSYLHLCDWWQSRACRSRELKLNDRINANLAGISVSSLRVRRNRSKDEFANLDEPLVILKRRMADLAEHFAPVVPCRPLPNYQSMSTLRSPDKENWHLPPSHFLPFLSRMNAAAPGKYEDILANEARAHDIPALTLKSWHERAQKLHELPRRNHNKMVLMRTDQVVDICRAFPSPRLPRLKQDSLHADRLYEAIINVGRDDPVCMREWLGSYVRDRIVEFNCAWLNRPDKAKGWLDMLARIIDCANTMHPIEPLERISALMYHHPTKKSRLDNQEQRRCWPAPPEGICESNHPVSSAHTRLAGGAPEYGAMAVWLSPPTSIAQAEKPQAHPRRISSSALDVAVFCVLSTAGGLGDMSRFDPVRMEA